jgi:hypothetical protein
MARETLAENRRIKQAVRDMLLEMDAEYFVTANFNGDRNYAAARNALKAWHARIDRKLLGGKWSKKARHERTQYAAFVEHVDSNIHWHLLLKLGDGVDAGRFEAVAADCWQQLVKSGELDVKKLNTAGDRMRTANYVVKDLWRHEAIERFVLSDEFRN